MAKEKEKEPKKIELTDAEITSLKERIKNRTLADQDFVLFEEVLLFMLWMQRRLEKFKLTINQLRKLLFGSKTEKSKQSRYNQDKGQTIGQNASNDTKSTTSAENSSIEKQNSDTNTDERAQPESHIKPKAKGHGRVGADAYKPDETIRVQHTSLQPGDVCPTGCGGKLYQPKDGPGVIIRVKGQPCAHITRYEFDKLRCALCGELFFAEAPVDFPAEKYDEYFKANIIVQKYFMASPFYRQEQYYKLLGIPLFDSTQWDLVESVADCAYPVFDVLEKMAANGTHINHDDTKVKILDVMRANKLEPEKKRKGTYTTCIFAHTGEHKICLYYSSSKHGGENVSAVLEKRDKDLPPRNVHEITRTIPSFISIKI